jgi:hypothetical protein
MAAPAAFFLWEPFDFGQEQYVKAARAVSRQAQLA